MTEESTVEEPQDNGDDTVTTQHVTIDLDTDRYECGNCGVTFPADASTFLTNRDTFHYAEFRYAGHVFYWRGVVD